jgi:hypothetical protein
MKEQQIDAVALFKSVLTKKQLSDAFAIFKAQKNTNAELSKLIEPAMTKIDATLGQKNDARYMAYLLEYVFSSIGRL